MDPTNEGLEEEVPWHYGGILDIHGVSAGLII